MSMEVYMSSCKVSEALKLIKINYQSERRKLPRQYQPVRITSPKKVVNRCVLLSMHDAKPEYRLKTRSDDWIWACFLQYNKNFTLNIKISTSFTIQFTNPSQKRQCTNLERLANVPGAGAAATGWYQILFQSKGSRTCEALCSVRCT